MVASTTLYTKNEQIREIIKCGKDPVYFIKNYVKIQHPTQGTIPFETYDFQDDCIAAFLEHRLNIVLKSRQLGLSTVSAAYAVWMAIFQKDKNILVIATKLATAINFIKKVTVMVGNIPKWLLLPKYEPSKQQVQFSNGSTIKAVPTSEDAGRSEALSLLIVDECVGGDALVEIRDTVSNEEFEIKMKDLYLLMEFEQKNVSYIYIEDEENLDTRTSAEHST
jgi:hypothetical protein